MVRVARCSFCIVGNAGGDLLALTPRDSVFFTLVIEEGTGRVNVSSNAMDFVLDV